VRLIGTFNLLFTWKERFQMTQQMQAHTFRLRRLGTLLLLGRFGTILLLAIAPAGLPGCGDGSDPTGPGEPAPGEPAPGEPAPPPAAPDLRFEPAALDLAPGDSASTTVRVEPAADLRGATFTLDGAPPGLSARFEAAADGASGTLTLAASPDVGTLAGSLMVNGRKGDGSKTWVGSLTLTVSSTTTRTFFVDPATGNDANRGTQDKPLKTLGKALSKARSGDTVKLAGGGYGPTATSGEQFPASGLGVAAGVTIEGALDGGFPVSTLVGTGGGVGLNFAGDATVRNLFVGGAGFGVGLFAKQGKQTLSNVFLGVAGQSAVVDGVTLSGGIVLRGTAQATLLAGASQANTSGSTIAVNGGTGVRLLEQAQFTMSGVAITLNKGTGVGADRQAQFTMDGGKIARADNLTCPTGNGISLHDSAQATLKNLVALTNLSTAVSAQNAAKATLIGTRITKEYRPGCTQSPSVDAFGSVALSFNGAAISATGGQGQGDIGIRTGAVVAAGSVTLTLKATTVAGHTSTGIELNQNETLTIDGGNIFRNGVGIDAIRSGTRPKITITGASLIGNNVGIRVFEPLFKLRKSVVRENGTGIDVRGQVGFVLCSGPCADLGTAQDPGNNNFASNTSTGVLLQNPDNVHFAAVTAVGNVWNSSIQGANSSGLYPTRVKILGGDPLAQGRNFIMSRATSFIEL
jgi:hypothetical protein